MVQIYGSEAWALTVPRQTGEDSISKYWNYKVVGFSLNFTLISKTTIHHHLFGDCGYINKQSLLCRSFIQSSDNVIVQVSIVLYTYMPALLRSSVNMRSVKPFLKLSLFCVKMNPCRTPVLCGCIYEMWLIIYLFNGFQHSVYTSLISFGGIPLF